MARSANLKIVVSMSQKKVALFLALSLVIISCGKNGNNVAGNEEIPTVDEITTELVTDSTSFLPGTLLTIEVTGTELTLDVYPALISGNTEVLLYRDTENDTSETLQFIVPETEPGETELTFIIQEHEQQIFLTVKEYEAIDNPFEYTDDLVDTFIYEIEKTLSTAQDASVQAKLNAALDSLNLAKSEITQLTDNEIRSLARYLKTNLISIKGSVLGKNKERLLTPCVETDQEEFKRNLLAAKIATISAIGVTASSPYFGAWGFVVAGIGLGSVAVFAEQWANLYTKLYECSTGLVITPQDFNLASNKNRSVFKRNLMLEHGTVVSGKIQASFEVPGDIRQATLDLRVAFSKVLALLPNSWIELANREFNFTDEADVTGIEVSVSNKTINLLELSVEDSVISFRPEYLNNVRINEEAFEINFDKETFSTPLKITGVLTPPPPMSTSEFRTIEEGEVLTDTLKGSFMNSFRIISEPLLGNIEVLSTEKGIIKYTPASFQTESDQFQFESVNSTGTSETATYSIDIKSKEVTYSAPVSIQEGNGVPWFIYPADLDGDGDMDLISGLTGLVNESGSYVGTEIVWYRNNGQGSFSEKNIISVNIIDRPNEINASDLDGDGDNDIIIASGNDNRIVWYENGGAGNFSAEKNITASTEDAYGVFSSHLDGDGDQDVLSASITDEKIAWYRNDGQGNFGPQLIINDEAEGARSVISKDLDGDGDPDILSASNKGSLTKLLAWYENNGQGGFGGPNSIELGFKIVYRVLAEDIDGDGFSDIIVIGLNDLGWYKNNGEDGFGEYSMIDNSGSGGQGLEVVDLDNDGDMDIIGAYTDSDELVWYENDGSGVFSEKKQIVSIDGAYSVYAEDMDGDNVIDIVVSGTNSRTILFFKGNISEN